MHYPGDYGFVPGAHADDGDPLDVLVMVDEPSYPGVVIYVRPLGMLEMVDQNEGDQKILAVPVRNPRFDSLQSIEQISLTTCARSSTSFPSTKSSRASAPKCAVGAVRMRLAL